MKIADRLGIADFEVSNGWIDRYCKKSGIAYKTYDKPLALVGCRWLNEAMNVLGATSTTHVDYVAVDAAVMMSECQTIAEIIANTITTEDNGDINDDEEHNPHDSEELAVESANLYIGEAVTALDYLRRYLAHQSDAGSNAAFQIIEKCEVLTSEQKKWQSSTFEYFKS
ncbi:hypothetical protein HPB51_022654 [Rhipicephalus microplus]|uniref:HTH CENPB-type domain-containing protein n=1 Tax=Rhipicephalus microplus TaxID=6941 RepID=A0A9J6E495_RHIMP|nr:hypothetical protein HPB51_022654 [Rhipicephalus microplus]